MRFLAKDFLAMESLTISNNSKIFIFYKRATRFVRTGMLLHAISILGLIVFSYFANTALISFSQGFCQALVFNGFMSISGLVIIVFAQLDAMSRFQNYKFAKDLFFEKGFQKRIANLFIGSRCQRGAIIVAANDLGISDQLKIYLQSLGYRWFHVIPDIVFLNPKILLAKRFWEKTLFAKSYASKYFLW